MLFKVIHGLVEVSSITLTPLTSCTRGHSRRYAIPPIRTETYLHSFLPSAVKLGNDLPQSLIKIDDVDDFKQELAPLLISHTLCMIICVCKLFQRF